MVRAAKDRQNGCGGRAENPRYRQQVESGGRRYRDLIERLQANTCVSAGIWVKNSLGGMEWSPCWIWLGAKNGNGYGLITQWDKKRKRNVSRLAHRVSYFAYKNLKFTARKPLLMHKCDTRPCIHPDHVDPGTQRVNVQQMIERGNGANQYGPYMREREPGEDDE